MNKKLIGKGAFTDAYLLDNGEVELHSCDPVKECMSLGWGNDHRMFPKMERVDDENGKQVFHMKYYKKVSSLKNNLTNRQWRLYKALRLMGEKFQNSHKGEYNNYFHSLVHDLINGLPSEFKGEKEGLRDMVDALGNFGQDICFEISPRNVAVFGGKLILLDCFFFLYKLEQVR